MCAKILAYVTYMGKYLKAYNRRHTFYLVIFLTIFPKLLIIKIEWKTGNLAKTNIEVLLKKGNPRHNLKIYFKKYYFLKRLKLCFLVTFNIIISYIFPENFIEVYQALRRYEFLLLRF